jgi:hypothetical protein
VADPLPGHHRGGCQPPVVRGRVEALRFGSAALPALQHGQVMMGLRVVGVQVQDRAEHRFGGLPVAAFCEQHMAEGDVQHRKNRQSGSGTSRNGIAGSTPRGRTAHLIRLTRPHGRSRKAAGKADIVVDLDLTFSRRPARAAGRLAVEYKRINP